MKPAKKDSNSLSSNAKNTFLKWEVFGIETLMLVICMQFSQQCKM